MLWQREQRKDLTRHQKRRHIQGTYNSVRFISTSCFCKSLSCNTNGEDTYTKASVS